MKKVMSNMWKKVEEHILEFFLIGVVFGIMEDMLAIYFYTGGSFEFTKALYVAAIVAIPLAIVSELIVDRTEIFRLKKSKKKKKNRK